jgi:hypothetical protein
MRVLLNRRHADERGAIAVIVALLAIVLLVSAAIVIDFGQAYVTKRKAQNAADAAVLAAAKVYSAEKGTCDSLLPAKRPDLLAAANKAAKTLRTQNAPGSKDDAVVVPSCNADGELIIHYEVSDTSPIGLGQLATDDTDINVTREAEATFDRPVRGESGMRPWAICSASADTSKTVRQVLAGNKDAAGACGGLGISGTWDRFACPGFKKGDGSDKDDKPTSTLYWIRNGCPNPASPIPTSATNPSLLFSDLVNFCSSSVKNDTSTEFCLTRDTGSAKNDKMADAWQSVIDAGLSFEVPMYCSGLTSGGSCSSDAITSAPVIPIYQIAVVRICGFALKNDKGKGRYSTNWPTTGPCATANPSSYTPTSPVVPAGGDAFYLVFDTIIKTTDESDSGGSSNLRLTK